MASHTVSSTILTQKLDQWIKFKQNVLFIGKHGVGKTAMVKEAWDRHKLNWLYFSASTMDPWVDFIGVPKERAENLPENFQTIKELAKIDYSIALEYVIKNMHLSTENANTVINNILNRSEQTPFLDLVRPKAFAMGEVEALFFDEFNRSPQKVRNAVMELIQFGSINGKSFPNLKFVWAAINPQDENDTYQVETLDPAQLDRFHVRVNMPYKPNTEWFRNRYGAKTADAAIEWWNQLDEENKDLVSPRRLQYALDAYSNRADLRDILPNTSNVTKLVSSLSTGTIREKISSLMESKNTEEAKSFLAKENNYHGSIKYIVETPALTEYFVPLMPSEKIASLIAENDNVFKFVLKNMAFHPVFKVVVMSIIDANLDAKTYKKIRNYFANNPGLAASYNQSNVPDKPFFKTSSSQTFEKILDDGIKIDIKSTTKRILAYEKIENNIPKNITPIQALKILNILDKKIFYDDVFKSTMQSETFDNLAGIINHCIIEYTKNPISEHNPKFKSLIESLRRKLEVSGMSSRMFEPSEID